MSQPPELYDLSGAQFIDDWNPDPVRVDRNGNYYFYCETWSDIYGPYSTEKECRASLKTYAKENLWRAGGWFGDAKFRRTPDE